MSWTRRRTAPWGVILIAAVTTAAAAIGFGVATASGQSGPGAPLAETVEAINQSRVVTILYITCAS